MVSTTRGSRGRGAGRALRLALGIAAAASAGCANTPPPATCAAIGAMLGGAGGAVGGAKSDRGHDGDSIAGYGALGILVGGGTGYLVCKVLHQEPEVIEVAETTPAPEPPPPAPPPPTEPDPCREVVRFEGVHFDFDEATIKPAGAEILEGVARRLDECREVRVQIVGHTDAIGTDAYNQGLSERRAASVQRFLVQRGLSASRFTTEGRGEREPVASNETREGRAENRRVELHPRR